MSAKKIKSLIKEFNHAEDMIYFSYRELLNAQDNEDEEMIQENEIELDFWESRQFEIEDELKKLNPSKYMINKYLILEDIMSGSY